MSANNRFLAALMATLAMFFAAVAFAAPSSSAPQPYRHAPALAVSSANPCTAASVTLSGTDFVPGSTVAITLKGKSRNFQLGSAAVAAGGNYTKSVTLPAGLTGQATFTARGHATSNDKNTATVTVTIVACSGVGGVSTTSAGSGVEGVSVTGGGSSVGGGGGTGGLASTGVAVVGVATLGLALLVGGFILVLGARRRRASA